MKKTYIQPNSQCINLFIEDAMLAASLSSVEVNKDKNATSILSNERGWSSDNWTNVDED